MAALSAGVTLGARPASAPERRAILIDQLGRTDPGTDFRRDAARILTAAGYAVEIVPPAEATVRRFQALPAARAGLVILRVHSALVVEDGRWTDDVALFTSDPVDLGAYAVTGLAQDADAGAAAGRSTGRTSTDDGDLTPDELAALVPVRRSVSADRRPYLGLGAAFVRDHLRGTFAPGTVVVLMGCDGLRGRAMSEAFLGRGARAVIGWSDQVSAAHTDRATTTLIADLAAGRSVTEAIRRTMLTDGRDPISGAYLIGAVSE